MPESLGLLERVCRVSRGFDLFLATREIRAVMPSARETVLVVDDEEMVRRLAARILLGEGYRVLEAADGQEALRMMQHAVSRIDGVLTDVAMPGLGGRQLGETISRCYAGVRVLYMSGFPAIRIVSDGALDPTAPFIQKPFTKEQLARKMRDLFTEPINH